MAIEMVIIGGGPGGTAAAVRAARMGASVTLVEGDRLGGTCLNWGCIPSKVMKTAAELLEQFHRADEFGIRAPGEAKPDMAGVLKRKDQVVALQAKGLETLLARHRIRYLKGMGRVAGKGCIHVENEVNPSVEVAWDRLILATGTTPMELPVLPFDGRRILSTDHIFNLSEVPESILIVGGGVIGCEFAFILASLGARVTVVEALPRLLPLPSVDEDCSKIIQREMKKKKIVVLLNATAMSADTRGNRVKTHIGPSSFAADGNPQKPLKIETETVLVCIGRTPRSRKLGLETIGLTVDEKGWIPADERMATRVPHVYAIGDALGPAKIMLAHVASAEGRVAAQNAMGGRATMDYNAVPGAIFTTPEVAGVGLTGVQAKERYDAVGEDSFLFRQVGKAQVIGEISGQVKIVWEKKSGRILGVHIVGPRATELIAEGVLAVRTGCSVKRLAETIHAHPTLAESMMEAAQGAVDRCFQECGLSQFIH